MNMNMNLFNHNNNADDYVQLNSCGRWIVRLAKPAHLKLSSRQSEKAEWNKQHENL